MHGQCKYGVTRLNVLSLGPFEWLIFPGGPSTILSGAVAGQSSRKPSSLQAPGHSSSSAIAKLGAARGQRSKRLAGQAPEMPVKVKRARSSTAHAGLDDGSKETKLGKEVRYLLLSPISP